MVRLFLRDRSGRVSVSGRYADAVPLPLRCPFPMRRSSILILPFLRVHYIPISLGYSEIYNVVSYFSGPPPSALRAAKLDPASSPFRGSTFRPPFAAVDDTPADEVKVGGGLKGGATQGIGAGNVKAVPPPAAEPKRPLGQVERRAGAGEKEKRDGGNGRGTQQQQVARSAAAEEGDRRLKRIARAGKQWKETMGRKVDMESA